VERSTLQTRRERLAHLLPKVGPVTMARDRVVPVQPALAALFPDGGLTRGSVLGCRGVAAGAATLAALAAASHAGSWVALAGWTTLGLRAAHEAGISLERMVLVADPGRDDRSWTATMTALVDGFDVVVAAGVPRFVRSARVLQARVQARRAVLVLVGDSGPFQCDLVLDTAGSEWEGIGCGDGRLTRRRVELVACGRRVPRQRRSVLWLPAAGGRAAPAIEPVSPVVADATTTLRRTG
jgi:hypothetical protein